MNNKEFKIYMKNKVGQKITNKLSLPERIHSWLVRNKEEGTWVSKKDLVAIAKAHDFTQEEIRDAFEKMEDYADIGKIFYDGKVQYCWYKLTKKQIAIAEKQKALWDSL